MRSLLLLCLLVSAQGVLIQSDITSETTPYEQAIQKHARDVFSQQGSGVSRRGVESGLKTGVSKPPAASPQCFPKNIILVGSSGFIEGRSKLGSFLEIGSQVGSDLHERSKWPVVWQASIASIERHFPSSEYRYIIATMDDIKECFAKNFPSLLSAVFAPKIEEVKKYDAGRACLLYQHGGIYFDFDYEPLMNFYDKIPCDGKVHLAEGPYDDMKPPETVQNCMMATPAKHPFWKKLMPRMKFDVGPVEGTGPILYSKFVDQPEAAGDTAKLACSHYNPQPVDKSQMTEAGQKHLRVVRPGCNRVPASRAEAEKLEIYGIHGGTCSWCKCSWCKHHESGYPRIISAEIFDEFHPESNL